MPRVAKKTSTFAPFQEEKQARRVVLVRAYLATLKRSRVELKCVTHLARYVAVHISEVEKAPCDPSTLLRNSRYKSLLLSYLANGSVPNGQDSLGAAAAGAQEMVRRLDAANLRRENDRLKAHLASVISDDRGDVPGLRKILSSPANWFAGSLIVSMEPLLSIRSVANSWIYPGNSTMSLLNRESPPPLSAGSFPMAIEGTTAME